MAVTITFTATQCSQGDHVNVVAHIGAKDVATMLDKSRSAEISTPFSDDQLKICIDTIIKRMIQQMASPTLANIAAMLNSKTIDITAS